MQTIIIVIPAYNEARNIHGVVNAARALGYDAVVVDDGSVDATSAEAERAGAFVLRHLVNRGYGAALTTGNKWALWQGYDIIVHFDADGQHEAADIEKLITPILSGRADVVLGSRFLKPSFNPLLFNLSPEASCPPKPPVPHSIGEGGWRRGMAKGEEGEGGGYRDNMPIARRLFIKLAIIFTWFTSGVKLTDAHNGLRAFSARALRQLDCRQDGMAYSSEIIDQIMERKLRFTEAPVTVRYTDYARAKGESNLQKILVGLKFLWGRMIK